MPKSPSKTSKKKKYNARFPPARIKKIMQTDEEVGKVAAAVPVIISRALELFIESLITETSQTTIAKNAKTLSTSHIKQTIESKKQFDFLRDLVSNLPDHQNEENNGEGVHTEADVVVKKGRGRPRKTKDPNDSKRVKGESSKASTDSSEEEEDEDDEGTETDEETHTVPSASASASYLPPAPSKSLQQNSSGSSQDRLAAPPGLPAHVAPPGLLPNQHGGWPPQFMNHPALMPLPPPLRFEPMNDQHSPQAFHHPAGQPQQRPPVPPHVMPGYPGAAGYAAMYQSPHPASASHPYPLPPAPMPSQQQYAPLYQPMMQPPHALPPHSLHEPAHQQQPQQQQQQQQQQSLPNVQQEQQQQQQPMNLSYSARAQRHATEDDDYDS
ncbi:dr1-associated corepressor [Aplysia californica]|uniref:Dr1-associated corepressor n=1 Tax=Aplysia californica TaxID=6500 RepID=A0ABM0JJX8_APLCA|nr:dr1-associated corepressor [Aplysia californica]